MLLLLMLLAVLAELVFPDRPPLPGQQTAWIPLAIAGGTALLGYLSGRKKDKAADRALQQNQARLDAAAGAEGQRAMAREQTAAGSRGTYLDKLGGFDPGDYARTTAGAIGDELYEQYGQAEGARRVDLQRRGFAPGGAVGSGRLAKDFNSRLARSLASLSMETAGMEQGKIDRYGDLYQSDAGRAELSRERELDLYAGNRDAAQANVNDRANRRSGLIGALANAGATYAAHKGW